MDALGVLEMARSDVSFRDPEVVPARPSTRTAFRNSVLHDADSVIRGALNLDSDTSADLERLLVRAQLAVDKLRSTTTLARLAQALEANERIDESVAIALEVLQMAREQDSPATSDGFSLRIALEVLLRAERVDLALSYAALLELDTHGLLTLAATLIEEGRFDDARNIIESVRSDDRDAVLAFLYLSEGGSHQAIPLLRNTLRRHPNDADSAHNLAVALHRSGANSKAVTAALRASRIAPGRQDLSLFYMEMLLMMGRFAEANQEVERLVRSGVQPVAQLLVVQARSSLGQGDFELAERKLSTAADLALRQDDTVTFAEVSSNLTRLRVVNKRISLQKGLDRLIRLHDDYPTSGAVVTNMAQLAENARHAPILRRALAHSQSFLEPSQLAYVRFQLASLEGDNAKAAEQAVIWWNLDQRNPYAASAAMVSLGIGTEQWVEAAQIAERAFFVDKLDEGLVNNAAYVIAMAGNPARAIAMLEQRIDADPILKATLGLAHLANHDVHLGMRLYREAATSADDRGHAFRSLMTAHQALVVRELGLDRSTDPAVLKALALPSIDLPADWAYRPEFLRLKYVAEARGYGWPLVI